MLDDDRLLGLVGGDGVSYGKIGVDKILGLFIDEVEWWGCIGNDLWLELEEWFFVWWGLVEFGGVWRGLIKVERLVRGVGRGRGLIFNDEELLRSVDGSCFGCVLIIVEERLWLGLVEVFNGVYLGFGIFDDVVGERVNCVKFCCNGV